MCMCTFQNYSNPFTLFATIDGHLLEHRRLISQGGNYDKWDPKKNPVGSNTRNCQVLCQPSQNCADCFLRYGSFRFGPYIQQDGGQRNG